MTRRMLSTATGSLHVIEIELDASRYTDFWAWRVEVRNLVDYRRRGDRWWRDFCMVVWLSSNGRVRGIAGLGSLTPTEVISTLSTRWTTTLRPLSRTSLRSEILAAIDPEVIAVSSSLRGRYQALKFSISPQRGRAKARHVSTTYPYAEQLEPMPVAF